MPPAAPRGGRSQEASAGGEAERSQGGRPRRLRAVPPHGRGDGLDARGGGGGRRGLCALGLDGEGDAQAGAQEARKGECGRGPRPPGHSGPSRVTGRHFPAVGERAVPRPRARPPPEIVHRVQCAQRGRPRRDGCERNGPCAGGGGPSHPRDRRRSCACPFEGCHQECRVAGDTGALQRGDGAGAGSGSGGGGSRRDGGDAGRRHKSRPQGCLRGKGSRAQRCDEALQ
mmetsp:Transcript_23052/g.71834  ORF Transcript_23052/g.71834 Transcript_23052/m.71834 type:complete len:228 (-) Transcript_23052:1290-1973(-)